MVMVPTAVEAGLGRQRLDPLRAPGLPGRADPAAFGAVQGVELQRAGRALDYAGGVAERNDLRMRSEQDANRTRDAYVAWSSQRRELLNNPDTGLFTVQGQAARGITKNGLDGLQKSAAEIAKGLDNDTQRQAFDRLTYGDIESAADGLSRHEAQQMRVWRQESANSAVDNAISDAVSNYTDPRQVQAKLGDAVSVIRSNVDGAPPEVIDQRVRAALTKGHAGVVEGLLNQPGGVQKARDWLGNVRGEIDGGAAVRLDDAITGQDKRDQAEARQRQREAESDARAKRMELQFGVRSSYQDELAAARDGASISPDLDKKIAAAFEPDQAKPMLEALHVAREEGSIGKSLATLPAPQIAQALEGAAPSGEGYAQEAAASARLQRAAADVMRRRQQDPAAEASRAFPGIAQGLSSGDPAATSAAVRQSLQVQRDVFGLAPDQVQPLTKGSAARVVDQFQGAGSVDEKLGLLSSLTNVKKDDGAVDYEAGRAMLGQLQAAGLPAGVDRALDAQARGDTGAARAIIGVLSLKPADLPKLTQPQGVSVADAVKGLRDATDTGSAVDARVAALTGQPDDTKAAAHTSDVIDRLTKLDVAAGVDAQVAAAKADKIVHGDGPKIVQPGLASVHLPAGADAGAVTAGMEALRGNVDLSYLAPTRERIAALLAPGAPPGAVEGALNIQTREFNQWADAVRQGAEFINHGDGFTLVPQVPGPSYGRPLAGPDGKPRVFSLDEVLKATTATPLQGTGGLGNPRYTIGLSGGSGNDTLAGAPSTDALLWSALTGGQPPTARHGPLHQDVPDAPNVLGSADTIKLGEGVSASLRHAWFDPEESAAAVNAKLDNLHAQVSDMAAKMTVPRVRKVIRNKDKVITHIVDEVP